MNRIYIFPKVLFLTLLITLLTQETRLWLIALYVVLSFVLIILFIIVKLAVLGKWYVHKINKGEPIDEDKIRRKVTQYANLANRLMRTEIEVTGHQPVVSAKPYFVIPNHQSNMDILIVLEALPFPVLFVAKSSLAKVPAVSDWMRIIDCTFLEKENMRAQILMMRETVEKLNQGKHVVLFPEGKRSHRYEMNEFKAGAFKMALKTEANILPVTINHAYKVKHRFPFRRTLVTVHFHEPIPYERYKDLKTNEISERVQAIVASKIIP